MVSVLADILASDINDLADLTTGKPLVRMIQTVAQTVSSATDTALTFTTEDIDTHGFHSTVSNTSRITPTVAGYYRLHGVGYFVADTDVTRLEATLGKNGALVAPRTRLVKASTATTSAAQSTYPVSGILTANGSTDYFELFVLQLQAAAASLDTSVSGTFSSVFECEFIRPL